jgi:hypothetical protein
LGVFITLKRKKMFSQIVSYFKEKTRMGDGSKESIAMALKYQEFAQYLEDNLPKTGEGLVAIRKLLESRDAAIRSINY